MARPHNPWVVGSSPTRPTRHAGRHVADPDNSQYWSPRGEPFNGAPRTGGPGSGKAVHRRTRAAVHEDAPRTSARLDVLRRRDTGTASAGPAVRNAEVHDAHSHPVLRQRGCLGSERRLDGLAVEARQHPAARIGVVGPAPQVGPGD